MIASMASAAPFKLWSLGSPTGDNGNAYFMNLQGGKVLAGHVNSSPMLLNTTGIEQYTNAAGFGAKGVCQVGNWIYQTSAGAVGNVGIAKFPADNWAATPVALTVANSTGTKADSICTDGTYIYSNSYGAPQYRIRKFAVATDGELTEITTGGWPVNTSDTTARFRSISYYNGKIYAANCKSSSADTQQVWEVDCATGTAVGLLSGANLLPPSSLGVAYANQDMYQVTRTGDTIFGVGLASRLHTWKLIGGTWTLQPDVILTDVRNSDHPNDECYGIAALSEKYVWINAAQTTYYFNLTPTIGDARKLADDTVIGLDGGIVTAKAADGESYWIEAADRSSAVKVISNINPAVGSVVNCVGKMTTVNGEKVFDTTGMSASVVGTGSVAPVVMTNKTLGGAGLAVDGMLVKVTGKVIDVDGMGMWLKLDDGSAANGGAGVEVTMLDGDVVDAIATDTNTYATVTGIVRVINGVVSINALSGEGTAL